MNTAALKSCITARWMIRLLVPKKSPSIFTRREVIATASSVNRHYVLGLGAHQVIDYSAEDFRSVAPPCDVVFDTVGGETQVQSYDVLKPSGRLVWIASAPSGFVSVRKDVWAKRPDVRRDRVH